MRAVCAVWDIYMVRIVVGDDYDNVPLTWKKYNE